jgi:hypothetical protein
MTSETRFPEVGDFFGLDMEKLLEKVTGDEWIMHVNAVGG